MAMLSVCMLTLWTISTCTCIINNKCIKCLKSLYFISPHTICSWDFIYAEYIMAAGYHHRSIVWQVPFTISQIIVLPYLYLSKCSIFRIWTFRLEFLILCCTFQLSAAVFNTVLFAYAHWHFYLLNVTDSRGLFQLWDLTSTTWILP